MKYLIHLLLFLVLSATTRATEYSVLPSAFSLVQNPCETIRNGQFVCSDCGTLGYCIQQNSNWVMMSVMDCDISRHMYCNEEAQGCTFQQQCKQLPTGPKFECQNPGTYPDPYNCKYYHVCDNVNVDELQICPSGTAYSPLTKTCSLSSSNAVCFEPQYNCTNFGQMGAWPTDNNIYYVCMVQNVEGELIRYPILYRCQNGYNFVQGRCVLAVADYPKVPSESPDSSDSSVVTTCVSGSSLTPNPSDCYSYYACVNGQLESIKCPTGTSFDTATKSCAFKTCINN